MKTGLDMLLWTPSVTESHFYLFEKLKAAGYDGVELEL
jgi:D-psicose/D-tagatose/L-ribulose 3-epimerase